MVGGSEEVEMEGGIVSVTAAMAVANESMRKSEPRRCMVPCLSATPSYYSLPLLLSE